MNNDIKILRELAKEYAQAASHSRNAQNEKLYRAVNGLKMIRPVVLISEEPWSELIEDGKLSLQCKDEDFRSTEKYIRYQLYKWNHHPVDMIITPYIPVNKQIGGERGWLNVDEHIIASDDTNHIVSHEYIDQLSNEEDIQKLIMPNVTYEKEATQVKYDKLANAIGDIIPIRIVGISSGVTPWDRISTLRGVTPLFMDLMDRPEHTHAIMERMTKLHISQHLQYEKLGLYGDDPLYVHCTAGYCDELSLKEGEDVTMKNVWGRGAAQIFASVSPAMHDEFDLAYQKRIMEPFGLIYYGCCEPLDTKIDIISKIPRLRKVSITPWADVDVAAEAIGDKYVVALKPNPAFVGSIFDEKVVRNEITHMLDACYRNNAHAEITLKDISTVGYHPENLKRWAQVVMEVVKSY